MGHLGLRKKVEEVEAHSQVVVEEVEVLHLEGEGEAVVGTWKHGQEEEEAAVGECHQVVVEEAVVVEEVLLLHPLVEVELQVQPDLPQSANIEQTC